jgi:GT2 family glycosyltransferase
MSAAFRISVVLPAYNAAAYLREALASVRWQSVSTWECICVDDGSTDESGEILRQFAAADGRFRLIRQENQGVVGALNRGIREAQHDWIAIMHADDIAAPKRFEVQRRFAQLNPDCVAIGSDMLYIDREGRPVYRQRSLQDHAEIERLLLAGKNTMCHPTVLMRRDAVLAAGLYREEYACVEDADLWLRLARHGRLANVPAVLLKYRLHAASLSARHREVMDLRLRAAVVEAHRERGLEAPKWLHATPSRPRRKRPESSRLARRAARAGYFRTARIHLELLKREQGLSAHTIHATTTVFLRRLLSIGRARRPPDFPFPDACTWDCQAHATPAAASYLDAQAA